MNIKEYSFIRSLVLATLGVSGIITSIQAIAQDHPVVQMVKRNAANYAIDGNHGGDDEQSVYLWSQDLNNINQQWYEIDRGNGYYTYQKVGTSHCLDGGNGGDYRQDLYLWACADGNQNQHWRKVDVGSGYYRLEKRNAPGYSIDGDHGGEDEQNIHLWTSDNSNRNQHWMFNYIDGNNADREKSLLSSVNWNLSSASNSDNLNNAIDGDSSSRWTTGVRQSAGQEFVIDFNESAYFDRVVLKNEHSVNDYPRGYSVSISQNGTSWTQVASGRGSGAFSVIDFSDQSARFVKLQQTSSDSYHYWSIHELEVWANAAGTIYGSEVPDDYTEIDSMAELENAFATSNGKFKMKPGYYTATKLLDDRVTILRTTANNSIYDFTGVTIDLPVKLLRTMSGAEHTHASWKMEGNNNTFIGGTFVNTYADGTTTITDWKAHNDNTDNRPGGNNVYLRIWGDNATFEDMTFVVRGSFPYGYGEIYGKGTGSVFGKNKHSGIQIVGDGATLDGIHLSQFAFGHGIFMQGASDTSILNTHVIGEMRLGADMYNDGPDSLPDRSGYIQYEPTWREGPIPKNKMFALAEDGIRSYSSGTKIDGSSATTGSVRVENTTVTNTRGGLSIVSSSGQSYVNNVELRGNEGGFNLPRGGGDIVNSRSDAAYGEILAMPYGNESNWNVVITLIEADHQTGDHYLANIAGAYHNITIRSDGKTPSTTRPIKVGYAWDRWDVTGDTDRHIARDMTITNHTEHDVELTEYSSGVSGSSEGDVIDFGSNNSVD
ncbi:MAG: RICIN domain-containing protein [Acidiferrobacterales bacterium]|nr:RICIN domain-containing protein [Acidiferrobacterales bacterium]